MKSDAQKFLIEQLGLLFTYNNVKTSIVEKNYGTFRKESWIFITLCFWIVIVFLKDTLNNVKPKKQKLLTENLVSR